MTDQGNSSPVSSAVSPLPPSMSPLKAVNDASLPALSSNFLNISKRRRLEPFSSSPVDPRSTDQKGPSCVPGPFSTPQMLPEKNRSVSTPRRLSASRTPSLTDRPIPVLSPPSPPRNITPETSKSAAKRRSVTSPIRGINLTYNDEGVEGKVKEDLSNEEEVEGYKECDGQDSEDNDDDEQVKQLVQVARWQTAVNLALALNKTINDTKFAETLLQSSRSAAQSAFEYIYSHLTNAPKEGAAAAPVRRLVQEIELTMAQGEHAEDSNQPFTFKDMLRSMEIDYDLLYDGSS